MILESRHEDAGRPRCTVVADRGGYIHDRLAAHSLAVRVRGQDHCLAGSKNVHLQAVPPYPAPFLCADTPGYHRAVIEMLVHSRLQPADRKRPKASRATPHDESGHRMLYVFRNFARHR